MQNGVLACVCRCKLIKDKKDQCIVIRSSQNNEVVAMPKL